VAHSQEIKKSVTIPEVTVYEAHRREDIVLRDVNMDTNYVCDNQDKVMYFNLDEAGAYLRERSKSLPSLPLLVNLYIALDGLAKQDEAAAEVLHQLNSSWDRTGTTISPDGKIVHRDVVLGTIAYEGLSVPEKGDGLVKLFDKNELFFQALLGVRDIDRLVDVATRHDLIPFYWYPRGERMAMFGGGDYYYMHQHIPGLLMLFCDDEPHPRRVIRGVCSKSQLKPQ
jgi:hypothetical protein